MYVHICKAAAADCAVSFRRHAPALALTLLHHVPMMPAWPCASYSTAQTCPSMAPAPTYGQASLTLVIYVLVTCINVVCVLAMCCWHRLRSSTASMPSPSTTTSHVQPSTAEGLPLHTCIGSTIHTYTYTYIHRCTYSNMHIHSACCAFIYEAHASRNTSAHLRVRVLTYISTDSHAVCRTVMDVV